MYAVRCKTTLTPRFSSYYKFATHTSKSTETAMDHSALRPLSGHFRATANGRSWPVRDFHLSDTNGRCTTHTGHRGVNG